MIILYDGGEPTFTLRPDVSCIREPDGKFSFFCYFYLFLTSILELEWVMYQKGMIESDLQEDPRIYSRNDRVHINIHRKQRSGHADVA